MRWILAERYGWTLDIIDNLDPADIAEEAAVRDALDKVRAIRGGGGPSTTFDEV